MNRRYDDIMRAIRGYLFQIRNPFVVDFGCGKGQIGRVLNSLGVRNKIFDIDEDLVRSCRKNGLNAYWGDITEIPLEDESVDIFICSEVLEHLTKKELLEALKEIDRVLSKEGVLLITTPEREDVCYKGRYHKNYISFSNLKNLLSNYELCTKKLIYKNFGCEQRNAAGLLTIFRKKERTTLC